MGSFRSVEIQPAYSATPANYKAWLVAYPYYYNENVFTRLVAPFIANLDFVVMPYEDARTQVSGSRCYKSEMATILFVMVWDKNAIKIRKCILSLHCDIYLFSAFIHIRKGAHAHKHTHTYIPLTHTDVYARTHLRIRPNTGTYAYTRFGDCPLL